MGNKQTQQKPDSTASKKDQPPKPAKPAKPAPDFDEYSESDVDNPIDNTDNTLQNKDILPWIQFKQTIQFLGSVTIIPQQSIYHTENTSYLILINQNNYIYQYNVTNGDCIKLSKIPSNLNMTIITGFNTSSLIQYVFDSNKSIFHIFNSNDPPSVSSFNVKTRKWKIAKHAHCKVPPGYAFDWKIKFLQYPFNKLITFKNSFGPRSIVTYYEFDEINYEWVLWNSKILNDKCLPTMSAIVCNKRKQRLYSFGGRRIGGSDFTGMQSVNEIWYYDIEGDKKWIQSAFVLPDKIVLFPGKFVLVSDLMLLVVSNTRDSVNGWYLDLFNNDININEWQTFPINLPANLNYSQLECNLTYGNDKCFHAIQATSPQLGYSLNHWKINVNDLIPKEFSEKVYKSISIFVSGTIRHYYKRDLPNPIVKIISDYFLWKL